MTKKPQAVIQVSRWRVGFSFNYLVVFLLPLLIILAFLSNKESRLLQDGKYPLQQNHEELVNCNCQQNHQALDISPQEGNHDGTLVHRTSKASVDQAAAEAAPVLPSSLVVKHGPLLTSLRGGGGLVNSSRLQNHAAILLPSSTTSTPTTSSVKNAVNSLQENHGKLASTCNMFSGTWVYDNESLPLYKDWNCSFMYDDLACEKYGRKDLNYQYWRWQPDNCDLPKFDAKALLEKLRDKRLVFVGDSLNRNQWVSFVCLVESAIPKRFKSTRTMGNLYRFRAAEYNASIDFYWAPFLVESNADNPHKHSITLRIVKTESIEKHAQHWTDADILVFNSYAWWEMPTLKVIRDSFDNPNASYTEVKTRKCYKMTMNTWSKYLLRNIKPKTTRMFWMSTSPSHFQSATWGMPRGKNPKCYNEVQPIAKEKFQRGEVDAEIMRLTESAIESLNSRGLKIDILNITRLSEYRKDAHPSIYRRLWRPLPKEQLANPINWSDCRHWCLPGVPDVWNQILYAYLMQ